MGFLVGNDFIPHLPHLHIHQDALPVLWRTYKEILPSCGGYLNDGGYLNLERFEKYLAALTKFEISKFSEELVDLKYFEGKRAEKSARHNRKAKAKKETTKTNNAFASLVDLEIDEFSEIPNSVIENNDEKGTLTDDSEEIDTFDAEFELHKRNYYMTKLEYEKVTPMVLLEQAEGYVRAIQWILLYYYRGVPSWSWFYPQHYAPYISDIRNFSQKKIEYDYASPFLPFQQLMAVLPSASKDLLPKPFQDLMTLQDSPVIDFYPETFKSDLNGKQQDWEAVVLIPFIEEERLLSAMRSQSHKLTNSEKNRNKHGPCLLYEYVPENQGTYPSSLPGSFCDIVMNNAKITYISTTEFVLDTSEIVTGLLADVKLNDYFPGFPTLKHIPHKAELKKAGVKVFQMNSRSENMMVHIIDESEPDVESLANDLLGKSIYVGWPHLYEAKVVSVSDDMTRFKLLDQGNEKSSKSSRAIQSKEMKREEMKESEAGIWHREVQSITEKYHDRLGVEVGPTFVLLHVLPMTGRRYVCGSHSKITMEKQFSTYQVPAVLQATVKDIVVHERDCCQYSTIEEMFPEKTDVFMLGWPHYGCQGEVLDCGSSDDGRVRISVTIPEEPDIDNITFRKQYYATKYMPSHVVAQRLGLDKNFVARMTGTIMIRRGSPENPRDNLANIGLNLKFSKRNEEVPGYTRLEHNGWTYSQKTVQAIDDYLREYPTIWKHIATNQLAHGDTYFESDIFSDKKPKLEQVLEYLKNLPSRNVKTQKCGAEILDEGIVKVIEEKVALSVELNKKKQKRIKMQVKPHLVYKPVIRQVSLIPDASATYQLFDRVVNVRHGFAVPFGLRGTVVGIHPGEREVDTLYAVVFDAEFQGAISVCYSSLQGYRVPPSALVNITHGERKNQNKRIQQVNQQPTNKDYERAQAPGLDQQGFNGRFENRQFASGQRNVPPRFQENKGDDRQKNFPGSNVDNQYRSQLSDNVRVPQGNHMGNKIVGSYQGNSDNVWNSKGGYSGERKNISNQMDNRQAHQQESTYRSSRNQKATAIKQEAPVSKNSFASQPFTNQATVQFVTPKVDTGSSVQGSGCKPHKNVMNQNDEFANMWKCLQGAKQPSNTRSVPAEQQHLLQSPVTQDSCDPTTSLQLAASSLKNIHVPSSGNTDSTIGLGQENQLQSSVSEASVIGKSSTETAKMAISDESEFSAILKSLDISKDKTVIKKAKQTEENSLITDTPKQDTTQALKQMLKIGSEDVQQESKSTRPSAETPEKSYGRQLSVQELFEGVQQQAQTLQSQNQASPQPPAMPQPQSVPRSGAYTTHTSQPAQSQQHPLGPPPPLHPLPAWTSGTTSMPPRAYNPQTQTQRQSRPQFPPGGRNPVMELFNFCKCMGLLPPRYDYKVSKDGNVISDVILPTGARFQGSLSRSKETAAESAASIAILQLKNLSLMPMHPMLTQMVPPGMIGLPPFSSSNSAFSPVAPRAVIPVVPFTGCPPHAPIYPTGNPREFFQNPPPQHRGGQFQQPQFLPQQIQATKYQTQRNTQPVGVLQQQVANISSVRTDGIGKHSANQHIQSFSRQSQQTGQISANQNVQLQPAFEIAEKDARNMGISPEKGKTLSSSANTFIPMQVTKQQKTPNKKKDQEQKEVEQPLTESTGESNPVCMDIIETQTAANNGTSIDFNNSASESTQLAHSPKPSQPAHSRDITKVPADEKPKRRKTRIAANFSSGQME
ncbi:hypothetical protein ScPMuIL_009510 [Solemya velum]